MLRLLRRCLVSLFIVLDGTWWYLACVSAIAGWHYGYAGLHSMAMYMLLVAVTMHFMLELFPMRWLSKRFERGLDSVWRRHLDSPGGC